MINQIIWGLITKRLITVSHIFQNVFRMNGVGSMIQFHEDIVVKDPKLTFIILDSSNLWIFWASWVTSSNVVQIGSASFYYNWTNLRITSIEMISIAHHPNHPNFRLFLSHSGSKMPTDSHQNICGLRLSQIQPTHWISDIFIVPF